MKKPLIIFAILMISNVAGAIIVDTPNSVGLYWDTDANVVDGVNYSPFMEGYVLITNPTFATFKGVAMFAYAGVGDEELPMVSGIMVDVPDSYGQIVIGVHVPNVVYDLASPVPTSQVFEVFSITLALPEHGLDPRFTTEVVDWYFLPVLNSGIPGAMYVSPDRDEDYVELIPVAPYGKPVAKLNGTGVVENENTSWGGIKSLYR